MIDADLSTALVTLMLGILGMVYTYRLGRNAKREAQYSRFEQFYIKLSDATEIEISNVLKLSSDAELTAREQLFLIWYFTVCEAAFHGKRYGQVEKHYVDHFMDSLNVKYRDSQAARRVLVSEGFDTDFIAALYPGEVALKELS